MLMYGAIHHVGDPYATFGQSWEPSNLYILMFDPMEATSACLTIIIMVWQSGLYGVKLVLNFRDLEMNGYLLVLQYSGGRSIS